MKNIKSISQSLYKKYSALKNERRNLSKVVGNEAVNFFTMSFRRQGWKDGNLTKWKPRKGEKAKTSQTKRLSKDGRGVLIGKGTGEKLSRSIKITLLTKNKIIVSTSKIYAQIHNEGLRGNAFGKYSFQMPKRQFMGRSKDLDKNTRHIIKQRINRFMK